MSKIRVFLTDDHTLFRDGIRTLLAAESDMEVVGESANALDAVALARQARPDVVLMDIGMAGMSSFEATRQIRKERPDTKVVFLSMYDDEDYLGECVAHRGVAYGLVAPLFEMGKVCANHLAHLGIGRYEGSVLSTKLKVTGIDLFSAGDFIGNDQTEEIVLHDAVGGVYKKLVIRDDRIVGGIMVG